MSCITQAYTHSHQTGATKRDTYVRGVNVLSSAQTFRTDVSHTRLGKAWDSLGLRP